MAISLTWQLLAQPQPWHLLVLASLLIVSSLLITSSWRRRSSGKGDLNLPPGPVGVPVLGNLHQLGSLPHRSLRKLARRHGPVMLIHLGMVLTVVISSASAAKEVMKDQDVSCCSRPSSPGPSRLSYGLKDVASAPYDEYWREMRRVFIVELLSLRRLKAMWGARQEQVEKLVHALSAGQQGQKTPVALDEHIFRLADGIIGTVAFGNVYGTDMLAAHKDKKRRFQQVLDDAMDMFASFSAEDFFPNAAGRLVDRLTGLVARRERIFRELDAFYETVIRQHLDPARTKPSNGGDLVDVLLSLRKEPRGTLSFTMDHVKALIMNTFVGAIDTSSVTILWAMSELIRKPRVLKKVQEEIRAVVDSKSGDEPRVQPDDVPKLSYLKMVVKETLRLHPPATLLLPRETTRHVRISGYDVPAKTRIFVNAWAIGRDAASWGEDAEEFDPDRFEASERRGVDYNGAHFELVPFGAGRRICPGMAMGVANVEFTLASLLCFFDWALPEGTRAEELSMEEAGGLIFQRKTPLVLVPTPYMLTPTPPCA